MRAYLEALTELPELELRSAAALIAADEGAPPGRRARAPGAARRPGAVRDWGALMAGRSDVEMLEDLLALEQRLVSAYEAALRRAAIAPELGRALRDQEHEHVRALEQALAGAGRRNPRASVPQPELTAALRDRDSFALFALDLEQEAARRVRAGRGRDPQPSPAPAARLDHGVRGRARGRAARLVRRPARLVD